MRRLNIAFVVDRFGNRWGGAEAYGVALMRELSRHHNVTVFARDYDPDCGLDLPYVQLKTRSYWPSWFRVLRHAMQVRRLTKGRYDIVHSHSNGWSGDIEVVHVTPVRYNWRVRPRSLLKRLTSHISMRVQVYLQLEQRRVAARPGHHVVAVSPLIASQLAQAYKRDVASAVVPPGVTVPASPDSQHIQAFRRELGYGDQDIVGILVARNPLRKGLETAMQAYEQLPSNHQLLVVGSSAATENSVSTMAVARRLGSRLKLVPVTSNVTPYYQAADLCLHPTRNDSFGMAPLEAMANGLPVVLSPSPWCGFAAYLEDKVDALILSHPDDVTGLAQALEQLGADQALRDALVQAGHEQADQHGWPAIAQQYLALYKDVLSVKSSREANKPVSPRTP